MFKEYSGIFYNIARRLVPIERRPKINAITRDISRFLQAPYYGGKLDFPLVVEIETNSACNLGTCWYCPNSLVPGGRGDYLMNPEVYNKIISDLKGIRLGGFAGRISPVFYGEPLLDERLPGLMSHAREELPRSRLVIYTNGILLSPKVYDNLVRSGVNGFVVTQHTLEKSENIRLLEEHLGTQFSRRIRYGTIDNVGLFNRGGLVSIPQEKLERPNPCFLAPYMIIVTHEGNVILCCNDYFGTEVFGNVMEKSLMDIWKDPNYTRIRREVRRGIFELPICKECVGISETTR